MTQLDTLFNWPVRIYWEDTDAGGIVFYANYLKFFERARTEWLRSLGIEQRRLKDELHGMFVVAETNVRYVAPARLDDELIVTAHVESVGKASLIINQQAHLKLRSSLSPQFSDGPPLGKLAPSGGSAVREATSVGAILCVGTIKIGWVDATTLQPKRIPAIILERLNT
jgi:acyl-CoA thioester hydrolase